MQKGISSLVVLICVIAGFSGFLFGFDSSVIADVQDKVVGQLALSQWQWSEVVSISLLGCVLGIPLSGLFADRVSRRLLLQMVAFGFIIGTLLCALATSFMALLTGRFIIGVCIGIASYVAPLFIAEIAPAPYRGTLVLINGVTITLGQALAYLIGYYLHDYSPHSWRYLFGIGSMPALVLLIGMYFVPHSPRWIMKRQGVDEALKVLKRIRPTHYEIQKELDDIRSTLVHTQRPYRQLIKKPVCFVLLVGIGLGLFQQLSGINAILYYGPVIFKSAGFSSTKNAILATFFMGLVNFVFTIITLLCVDKLGRRRLLLGGTFLAGLSLFVISVLFHSSLSGQSFWIAFFLAFYVMGYCISVGSLFWVLIAEIYPLHVRGMAMSIATFTQWGANFVVSLFFLSLYQSLGQAGTFCLFASLCWLGMLFVYYFVPETSGISLEQIEKNLFSGKKIREIGQSVDYLRQYPRPEATIVNSIKGDS